MSRPADKWLYDCTNCGKKDCNRVIDRRDGSILPARDTGFRMKHRG